MAKGRYVLAALGLLLIAATTAPAAAQQNSRYAAFVIDDSTGRVLHQVNADAKRYPASLTKMMTLYMTFDALEKKRLKIDQRIPVSTHAANQAPSRLGLTPGESLSVRNVILGLVTKSANDAAAAIGEALAGSEAAFAVQMTKRAHALGMTDTVFKNASGLPNSKQFTTARDMATLARALRRDFPQYYHYFATPEFAYKGRSHRNHNRLLGQFEGADGIKTGFINASGFNLAASVQRGNRRIVGVVLGGDSGRWRDARMMQLVEQAFNNDLAPPSSTLVAGATTPKKRPRGGVEETALVTADSRTAAVLESPVLALEQGDTENSTVASLPPVGLEKPASRTVGWAIQVGAFSRKASAQRAAAQAKGKLPKTLKNARIHILESAEDGSTLFRARLTGMSESTARSACRQLEKRKVGCLTLTPTQSLSAAAG